MNDIDILLNYNKYESLFSSENQIKVEVNLETISFPESFIDSFVTSPNYFGLLKKALTDRVNINFILIQDEEVLLKNVYSPVSIIMGISTKIEKYDFDFQRNFMVLMKKVDFRTYIAKKASTTFKINIDNQERKMSYGKITSIILNAEAYHNFNDSSNKYDDFSKEEYVYILKEFLATKRLFLAYNIEKTALNFYENLVQKFDTEAFNQYVIPAFEYSAQVNINRTLEENIIFNINNNNLLKKAILIYLNLLQTLIYDFEYIDDKKIKSHKDFTRIEEITLENNKVFPYEFSCLFAKFLEKIGINFEYSDDSIKARVGKYLLEFKAISSEFNKNVLSKYELIKGITLLNKNSITKLEFNELINSISDNLYKEEINKEINNMPLSKLVDCYKEYATKVSISFSDKYNILCKLISSVKDDANAIGYILALKKILFSLDELENNISFATIASNDGAELKPVVIITVNKINIKLSNSNKYIYYNPPEPLKKYNLKELRLEFFYGRLKYIKGTKDNIIGLEKSSVC